jgi:hypothetical protein
MKCFLIVSLFLCRSIFSQAQTKTEAPNIFIITVDGFRWQEVFRGADTFLIKDPAFVKDTNLLKEQYWSEDAIERKQKLMPFFWNVISKKGVLIGNRDFGSKVNVANIYKISYPGYNEILTGYADKKFIANLPLRNYNSNILSYLNSCEAYAGKVAAFSSWNVLPYILDEKHNNFIVNGGYELLDDREDSVNKWINAVQNTITNKSHTRQDALTYASAKNYIEQNHPKVLFLGLGETDEFAHKKQYDQYLHKAKQMDQIIGELWYLVQTDPFYKNNTTFIITTDHGRGSKPANWSTHGFWIKGSGETWMALLGYGINKEGELKNKDIVYLKQIASTISYLADEHFEAIDHPVASPLSFVVEGKK